MKKSDVEDQYLSKLKLKRLTADEKAGLAICSLPIPDGFSTDLSLAGKASTLPTSVTPLGCWPNSNTPRRLLMAADLDNDAPETLSLSESSSAGKSATPPPQISMELFETCQDPRFMWERHVAKISYGGKSIGLIMGMNTGGEVHWWEACRLQVLSQDDFCVTVEVGGTIPQAIYDAELSVTHPYYKHPYLHVHNWLQGRIFMRMYANGVCEVYAHHINSKFFDEGLDLKDCVPVIGFKTYDAPMPTDLCGQWAGDKDRLHIGHANLDIKEAARLATQSQPGQFLLDETNGFFVWQPYMGAELYGGVQPYDSTGDGFIFRAENKVFPKGFARTIRFSFSLSDRSPVIARYLPPAWSYGLSKEFMHDDLLPVSDQWDMALDQARVYTREYMVKGGFEDGGHSRNHGVMKDGSGRHEPSWEGEYPHTVLMDAWRSGIAEDYENGLRMAYAYDDIYVDHATNTVRMHGYGPPAISVPMMRVNGIIAAYLETGDLTLKEDAMCLIDNAFRLHKNSWPRLCIGRDAMFIRGAIMYYRYFGDAHYLQIARNAISDVILTQRPDGSFGDQGGGTGLHQWAGYIVKPWMGFMATGGLVDYLEVVPEDEDVLRCVLNFGDFLLREQHEHAGHPDPDGPNAGKALSWSKGMGWSYQHYFRDGTTFYTAGVKHELKTPYQDFWHQEYLARTMTFCSIRTGNPAYYDLWAKTGKVYYGDHKTVNSDHSTIEIQQFIPWVQDKMVGARFVGGKVECKPYDFGPLSTKTAIIHTPDGDKNF